MGRSIGLPADKIFSCETGARWAGEAKMPGWCLDRPNREMAETKGKEHFSSRFFWPGNIFTPSHSKSRENYGDFR
ncbi:MAG: hypothetical protein ACKVE3_09860 [Dissulfuribacterales bacterium]